MKFETENKIQKCKNCKDYDDTWDIECFCNDCQKLLRDDEK